MPVTYKVLEVRVRQFPSVKVPEAISQALSDLGEQGWRVAHVTPVMGKGLFGGSYTDSLLVMLEREAQSPAPRG